MNISHQLTCLVLLTLLSCTDIQRTSGTDARIDTSQDLEDVTQVDTGGPDPADSNPVPVDTAVADTSTNDSGPSPDTSTPTPDTVETEEVDAGPVMPPFNDPSKTGPYAVSKSVIDITAGPLGALTVAVYEPELTLPRLIVFAPGFQIGASSYEWVGEHLASHGFAVLIPSFDDSPFSAFDHADLAASLNALVDQALQPGQIFSQNIDPEHIGMGGHSRGGKAALLAAIQSPRPKAVCTLDPVDSLGSPFDNPAPTPENPSVTPELMGGLTVPSGYVGAGMGAEGIVPCAPKEDNYHEYYKAAATPAYEWLLEDAGHGDFAENGGLATQFCNSNADAQTVRNFSATTLVAFFQVYLGNAPAYQPWLDGDKLPANVALSTK